jgi:glycosyltransferase involved in cell wall biosynthesis
MPPEPLVSVCLPVRNGAHRLEKVVRSVLAQEYGNLELIISDNASTDHTEEVCRDLARTDPRIAYHRQPRNIGLLNNFIAVMRLARGTYTRWVGDDDSLAPTCVSRCLDAFAADDRLVLVTMQVDFTGPDGTAQTAQYHGDGLSSDDPVTRFTEMLRLLNQSHLLIDPLYGLMRRAAVAPIPRRNMLREDEVFAAKLALAGPWAHVNEVLAERGWKHEKLARLARRLDVPVWQAHAATALQCRELLRWIRTADLDTVQRRRARAAVLRLYLGRHQRTIARRSRRLAAMAGRLGTARRKTSSPVSRHGAG